MKKKSKVQIRAKGLEDSMAPDFLFPTESCGSAALKEILVLYGPVRAGKLDNCILSPDCSSLPCLLGSH